MDENILTDQEIELLEERGIDLEDPKAVRDELDFLKSEAEDRAIDSEIAASRGE